MMEVVGPKLRGKQKRLAAELAASHTLAQVPAPEEPPKILKVKELLE